MIKSTCWKIKNGLLSINEGRPLIMGILNITPDSFSDGGIFSATADQAVKRACQLAALGSDIIDIGGQSTRPGHTLIGAQEEWERLAPVLELLKDSLNHLPPISVDTYYPYVAQRALERGAAIINDVSGFDAAEMRLLAAQSGCGCVVMHHDDITSSPKPVAAVRSFFEKRIEECLSAGIKPEQIVLDIGIGFGKTREQELELINRCGECSAGGLPIFVGASRKRLTVWMLENDGVSNAAALPMTARDPMTHRLHRMAVDAGAAIIRVHDVCGAKSACQLRVMF